MELTPKLLTEVEFPDQRKGGYAKDQVDDFLERVAAAVGELLTRLEDAEERAARLERELAERPDEDEVRRTLVLAQRTAVSAVEEARAEAKQLVEAAQDEAAAKVAELEDRRALLGKELAQLQEFVDQNRQRLIGELRRQLEDLERGGLLDLAPLPDVFDDDVEEGDEFLRDLRRAVTDTGSDEST